VSPLWPPGSERVRAVQVLPRDPPCVRYLSRRTRQTAAQRGEEAQAWAVLIALRNTYGSRHGTATRF
jgi:hypothetical protein